jgi:uncharacterized phage protein (TIGR01671 family)
MREFKFRAWEIDSQEMFYPDTTNNNEYFFSGFMEGFLIVATSPYSSKYDYVIMQYTGLKDKNVKEIYEGDILRLDAHQDFFVDFHEGCFVCRSTNRIQKINWAPASLRLLIEKGYEVIGNIYDNPDLITH